MTSTYSSVTEKIDICHGTHLLGHPASPGPGRAANDPYVSPGDPRIRKCMRPSPGELWIASGLRWKQDGLRSEDERMRKGPTGHRSLQRPHINLFHTRLHCAGHAFAVVNRRARWSARGKGQGFGDCDGVGGPKGQQAWERFRIQVLQCCSLVWWAEQQSQSGYIHQSFPLEIGDDYSLLMFCLPVATVFSLLRVFVIPHDCAIADRKETLWIWCEQKRIHGRMARWTNQLGLITNQPWCLVTA